MHGFAVPIPGGDAGTFATLGRMRMLARRAAILPVIRMTTAELVRDVPPPMQPRVIQGFVTERTTFLPDPTHAELLHSPEVLMQQILTRGIVPIDCDDVAMLTASMALAVGLRARFVVVGFRSSRSAPFRHVWTDIHVPGSRLWLSVDPTRPLQPNLGQVPTRRVAMEV